MQRIWSPTRTSGGVRLYAAVLLTLGAALIHLAVAPAHLREYAPFGIFFLAVGSAQIVLAVELIARPTRRLTLAMAIATLACVGLWFASRTVGLPFGPTPGIPEGVGLTDTVCTILEIISSLLFASLAAWPARRQMRRLLFVGLATLPNALLTTGMTAIAVAATLNGVPEATNAAPASVGQPTTSLTQLTEAPGNEPVDRFTLTAQVTPIDGQDAWTYNGSVPGPELRVTQGHRVQVTLVNHLPESTSLHWHGLQIPNAEDGVAGLTQDAVAPGHSMTYEFVAREIGTYWYHSHQQTEAQLPRGLFGAIVVEPANPAQQRDVTLVLHGSTGSQVSINGEKDNLHIDAHPGETVRLRLVNAVVPGMDGGPEAPMLLGAPYQVVALDGRELNAPELLGPTRIPLAMGQRADLGFTMPAFGTVRLIDTEILGETSPVQKVFFAGSHGPQLASVTLGEGATPSVEGDVQDVPLLDVTRYGAATTDPIVTNNPDVTAEIVLDKHPGIRDGRPQVIHTINGLASPNVAPINVEQGQVVHLHIVNNTEEYHPMHLHGHVMSVIAKNGQSMQGSPVHLDSLLVGPRDTWDVAFVADNPGVWMFHCHVLLHAAMGMVTTLNYAGISTPFEMGSRSGNMPE
jgi:FtsP/CotA-like multicopper oxidase with cupredoxin domain